MTVGTRNFVVASLVVLGVGLGTGLFAYFGRSASALTVEAGPEDVRFVPKNATIVAFANVRDVMASELRQKVGASDLVPGERGGSLKGETGIDLETDIDRMLVGTMPVEPGEQPSPSAGVIIARGRFDAVKIERAMRERGARVDDYKGTRLVTTVRSREQEPGADADGADRRAGGEALALAFVEPGLIAFGGVTVVKRAIDAGKGGESVLSNTELISRIRPLDGQSLWAVGRFDALPSQTPFTQGIVGQLPVISWFTASGRIDSGVQARLTAETRDEASANGLRDMVRGLVAVGRMQAGSRPEFGPLLESVQIGGAGQSVTVTLDVSPRTLDLLTDGLRRPAGTLP